MSQLRCCCSRKRETVKLAFCWRRQEIEGTKSYFRVESKDMLTYETLRSASEEKELIVGGLEWIMNPCD